MAKLQTLFPTEIYHAALTGARERRLIADLEAAALSLAREDGAGRAWCRRHGYRGYTSYASLGNLVDRASVYGELVAILDCHARDFARNLEFALDGQRLVLNSLWVNILEPGGYHTAHIHPGSVISGTVYIRVPEGAGAIRFEDPRLAMMMAAPMRRERASEKRRTFVEVAPKPGTILLWESWLRHEVPENRARSRRVSLSFNYGLEAR
ncbi:MAG TPA: TIGR02466 family protein [Hyphomicrobiaceae bacterium]|nr:TIGR02466 family protein [Hyphomicrobiaceae bacterium]